MLNTRTDVHSIGNNAKMAVNEARTVRMLQNNSNTQNSPTRAVKHHINEPNGLGQYADTSSVHMDVQSIVENARMPANETERIRMHRNSSKTQNSPNTRETEWSKHADHWRRVSADGINIYIPQNAPIDTTS